MWLQAGASSLQVGCQHDLPARLAHRPHTGAPPQKRARTHQHVPEQLQVCRYALCLQAAMHSVCRQHTPDCRFQERSAGSPPSWKLTPDLRFFSLQGSCSGPTHRRSVHCQAAAAEHATASRTASQETLYDAIIVGAGMGGLTTATQMAAKGAKVLVLEKQAPGLWPNACMIRLLARHLSKSNEGMLAASSFVRVVSVATASLEAVTSTPAERGLMIVTGLVCMAPCPNRSAHGSAACLLSLRVPQVPHPGRQRRPLPAGGVHLRRGLLHDVRAGPAGHHQPHHPRPGSRGQARGHRPRPHADPLPPATICSTPPGVPP